jgi:iduronate 2-sulfatase
MNVLLIISDDLRFESATTPNIARLAYRGIFFERTYAQATTCSPSRSSFLTGRAPDVNQIWYFEGQPTPDMVSMPTYFRRHNYISAGAGKVWHFGKGPKGSWSSDVEFWPSSSELSKMCQREGALLNSTVGPVDLAESDFVDAQIARRASELLQLFAARQTNQSTFPNQPFFLAVGFHLPHEPLVFPVEEWAAQAEVEELFPSRFHPLASPSWARGDILEKSFKYYEKQPSAQETRGVTYGPPPACVQGESPSACREREHKFPMSMRHEILRAYNSGVGFMDKQIGRVLDALWDAHLEASTIVVLTSDHGYSLGEKGQ